MSINTQKSKIRQIISYGVFGVLTTIINLLVFKISIYLNIQYIASNFIAFLVAILFAYFTNRSYVFNSSASNVKGMIIEFVKFVLSRSIVLVIEFIGLYLLIETFSIEVMSSKVIMTIITIVLNYVFSKKFIFQTNEI